MNNIVTDEADPLAEAEAYLTRGRDRNAESVLKEAIAKDPSRYELKLAELKLELLAIYRQRHDASAFDPLAEELYAELGGRGGELWDRLEAMGRCLNPHNPVPRALPGDNMHGDVATQRDVSAIRNYREVERRKRSRRTIADRRDDETSWRPTVVNRRQTPGRRREDRF